MSSNIRQKRSNIRNPHKIVLDLGSSNFRSISTNNSFVSISFASNENDQENSTSENSTSGNSTFGNSTSGTKYKSSNQTVENRANIQCKPVTKELQEVKRLQLIFEEREIRKQVKSAEKEAVKQEVVEK